MPIGLRVLPSVEFVALWTLPERRSGQRKKRVAYCPESCPLRIIPGRYRLIVRGRNGRQSEKDVSILRPELLTATPGGGSEWSGGALLVAGGAIALAGAIFAADGTE